MLEALQEHLVDCELLVIRDGDTAIRYLQAVEAQQVVRPDLIAVDLNLPKRPGLEVLAYMRSSTHCRECTVIVLSSSDATFDRSEVLRLGASQYIRKPLRIDEFLGLGAVFKQLLDSTCG